MKLKTLCAPLIAGCALLFSHNASATTLIQLSLPEMVDQSAQVVVGEAVSQTFSNTEDGLYTVTTFSVSDAVVGESGSEVTVAVPGGIRTINGRRFAETWPGAPRLVVGQRAVLFLTSGAADSSAPVGFSQGVLNVFDTENGAAVRLPNSSGPVSLEEAKAKIRAAKAQGNGPGKLGD